MLNTAMHQLSFAERLEVYQKIAGNVQVKRLSDYPAVWWPTGSYKNKGMCKMLLLPHPRVPSIIYLGEFDDLECEIASFFHELGHTQDFKWYPPNSIACELNAWRLGLKALKEEGFTVTPKIVEWIKRCINTYKHRRAA